MSYFTSFFLKVNAVALGKSHNHKKVILPAGETPMVNEKAAADFWFCHVARTPEIKRFQAFFNIFWCYEQYSGKP